MANAWGNSWGTSWGGSWGETGTAPQTVSSWGASFKYLVARHICKSILNVYRYGVRLDPSTYTVTTGVVDGYEMTFLEFAEDQRDEDRSNEIEITVDVQGITRDGLSTGILISNPIEQLKHYLTNFAGVLEANFSATHYQNTFDNFQSAAYLGAWAIIEDTTHEEVINQFNESFNSSLFLTRYGLYAPFYSHIDDLTDIEVANVRLSDQDDILKESFEIYPIEDVASRLQYNYQWNYLGEYFERQPDLISTSQQTILGLDVRQNVNLWCVVHEPTAQNAASDRIYDLREGQELVRFTLPVTNYGLDLNDYLRITHWQGIKSDGAGYESTVFRVIGLNLELQPDSMQVVCTALKLFDSDDVWGQYMRLGDENTMAATWLTASADDKTYLYLADESDLTGGPGGTLGTSDRGKLLW